MTHMRTHTSERLYPCTVCHASFNQIDHLALHMLIHNQDNLYQCTVCKQTFKDNNELTLHMQIHLQYQCTVCKSVFYNSPMSLAYHTSTNACHICNWIFNCTTAYMQHIQDHSYSLCKCTNLSNFGTMYLPNDEHFLA